MNFAENLRNLRMQNKLSQQMLAARLKISQSNISDWGNGVSRPEYENLISLADIFDVSLDELLGRKQY